MAETQPDTFSNALFDAYRVNNVIERGHEQALEFQSILNGLRPDLDSDEFDQLIAEATHELDNATNHIGQDITVTGNIRTVAIDPRGIDIDNQELDPEAIREASHYVEDATFESMGYLIEPRFDEVVISHIAKGGLATLISSVKYGDLYMSNRIYIPIDGTAFVVPAFEPDQSPQAVLELYADDLLQEVDVAILNANDHTDALRSLGNINLTDYKRLIEDNSVARALNEYITTTLDIGSVAIYQLSGADRLDIKFGEDSYGTAYIDPEHTLTGNIEGVIIDEDSMKFALHTTMPFSDDTTREVIYPLSPSISVTEQATIRIA